MNKLFATASLFAVLATVGCAQVTRTGAEVTLKTGSSCVGIGDRDAVVVKDCADAIQVTPASTASNVPALIVEGFSIDGRDSCMAVNAGKVAKVDCSTAGAQFMALENNMLVSGAQCVTGVDNESQLQVGNRVNDDQNCVKFDTAQQSKSKRKSRRRRRKGLSRLFSRRDIGDHWGVPGLSEDL